MKKHSDAAVNQLKLNTFKTKEMVDNFHKTKHHQQFPSIEGVEVEEGKMYCVIELAGRRGTQHPGPTNEDSWLCHGPCMGTGAERKTLEKLLSIMVKAHHPQHIHQAEECVQWFLSLSCSTDRQEIHTIYIIYICTLHYIAILLYIYTFLLLFM